MCLIMWSRFTVDLNSNQPIDNSQGQDDLGEMNYENCSHYGLLPSRALGPRENLSIPNSIMRRFYVLGELKLTQRTQASSENLGFLAVEPPFPCTFEVSSPPLYFISFLSDCFFASTYLFLASFFSSCLHFYVARNMGPSRV